MVVVEDVQWADNSSLGLLAYLVRRLSDWPLLLVLSWQSEQAGRLRVLRTALSEAEGQSLGETVEPGPLGPAAIGALLDLDGMPQDRGGPAAGRDARAAHAGPRVRRGAAIGRVG